MPPAPVIPVSETAAAPWWPWDAMPLRRRLVLGLLAVLTLTLLVVASATFLALRAWTVRSIDSGLMQAKTHVFVDNNEQNGLDESFRQWQQTGAYLYVVYPDGSARPLGPGVPGGPLPGRMSSADAAALASVPTGRSAAPVTIDVSEIGDSRAVAVRAFTPSSEQVTIVAAAPLSRADAVAGRLLVIEIIAVAEIGRAHV